MTDSPGGSGAGPWLAGAGPFPGGAAAWRDVPTLRPLRAAPGAGCVRRASLALDVLVYMTCTAPMRDLYTV